MERIGKTVCGVLALCAAVCGSPRAATAGGDVVRPFERQAGGRPICVVNGDNDHYFKARPMKSFLPVEARFTEAGMRKYIDILVSGGKVTHYFACAIGQRANYDSKACDPMWLAIDEAMARGLEPDEWPLNVKRMYDAGLDCYQVWCTYGRSRGISVWISQRMNDVHFVDRPWDKRTNRFWYEHPELRRAQKGGWTDLALDYSKPEVQAFEFGIFKELVDRYDADGFELDFMRFWEHLTPGKEREQAPILTAFIRRCRDYANAAAAKRGHPVLLATRVPTSYASCRAFGYDPEAWAREGLVDMIAVANFFAAADYDFDFAGWKARLAAANPSVVVLPCICDNLGSGAGRSVPLDLPALRGWADNAYAEGAEGLYFFNAAYYADAVQRGLFGTGFSPETVRIGSRRHLVSYHDCTYRKFPAGRQLPRALAQGGALKVRIGSGTRGVVGAVLAFSADVPPPALTLNGVSARGEPVREADPTRYGRTPKAAWRWTFPTEALKPGWATLAFAPVAGAGNVVWAEIVCDETAGAARGEPQTVAGAARGEPQTVAEAAR